MLKPMNLSVFRAVARRSDKPNESPKPVTTEPQALDPRMLDKVSGGVVLPRHKW